MVFGKFNIFKTLLKYPDLILELVKQLPIDDLVSLYAISKDFHRLANSHFTAMILAHAEAQSPESARTFIFRCYKSLCMFDPALRRNESIPNRIRYVPSLRWLRMITYRERVVKEILICLSNEGLFLPTAATLTLKKIWFTIDIGDNGRRIGILHNTKFWTDRDLFIATMFFLKLDMRLTNPLTGTGEIGLRNMLLGQRSLATLLRVLKRQELLTDLELLRMMVRYDHRPARHHARHPMMMMSVPRHEVGQLSREGWGSTPKPMLRIDELVMREGVRRRLRMQDKYVDMMLYGFVDKRTFEDRWHTEISLEGEKALGAVPWGGREGDGDGGLELEDDDVSEWEGEGEDEDGDGD